MKLYTFEDEDAVYMFNVEEYALEAKEADRTLNPLRRVQLANLVIDKATHAFVKSRFDILDLIKNEHELIWV